MRSRQTQVCIRIVRERVVVPKRCQERPQKGARTRAILKNQQNFTKWLNGGINLSQTKTKQNKRNENQIEANKILNEK